MKRFMITLAARTTAEEGYVLGIAAKILNELQAIGTGCRLVSAPAPWQIAMEGDGDLGYIQRQVLDIFDGRRGSVLITEVG